MAGAAENGKRQAMSVRRRAVNPLSAVWSSRTIGFAAVWVAASVREWSFLRRGNDFPADHADKRGLIASESAPICDICGKKYGMGSEYDFLPADRREYRISEDWRDLAHESARYSVLLPGIGRWLLPAVLLALNKPYGMLSQFTPEADSRWRTLAELGLPPRVYPIGRLDADSEGLLLLTDETELNERLLHPRHGHEREYWVQVERVPDDQALTRLAAGVTFGGFRAQPCRVLRLAPPPAMPAREPPIRFRKNVPDCWLALELTEGKNRQVRRMTAAVGHPTLRLVRVRIGRLRLDTLALAPGQWRELVPLERAAALG